MRGLNGRRENGVTGVTGVTGRNGRNGGMTGPRAASTTAVAVTVLAAVGLFATGCSTGGTGARDEGAAPQDQGGPALATPTPSASSSPAFRRVDVVRLIKDDPKVSERVKNDLKPCVADAYPVDTSYGNLTGTGAPDVVVNVLTCGDAVGIGTYVYRLRDDDRTYENVFALEEPAVYSAIDRGDLIVTKQRYEKDDPVAYPSGEDVVTFRWAGNRFTQHDIVRNEYSKAVDGGDFTGPAPTTAPGDN
ncbi:hypothetical protein [Streptomyces sp. TRM64462]|uniref:hypothetical protein n=1 Tax=Streptomyces sp. TRM64462 TaxID=2741726 RepID=UPI001586C872|nr:hypothetical protein [Streptomyces sp. TRM64462]